MAVVFVSAAWMAGIALGSWLRLPPAIIALGLLPLPLMVFGRWRRQVVIGSTCLLVLLAGAVYARPGAPSAAQAILQQYADGRPVELKGLVSRPPDVGANDTRLYFSVRAVRHNGGWQPADGACLLTVRRYPAYAYGDVLGVSGRLKTPPDSGSFDYRAYLAREGVSWTMSFPEIEVLGTGKGSWLLSRVYTLRDRLSASLARVLPEPQAALAQGVVLGERGNVPADVEDEFVRSGTAHILAISGVNLTIIAGVLVGLTVGLLGRRHYVYIWVTLALVWLYALLTGLQPPVLRAAIMLSVFLVADLFGRQRSGAAALFLAGAVMAGVSPPVLGDASFQMSFGAMAGLVFIAPSLQAAGRRLVGAAAGEESPWQSAAAFLVDSLAVSLAAVIAVWPLIAHYFGLVSWVGPLATLLALPALTAIIVGGALAGGLGLLFLPLGQAVGWLAWLPLSYLLLVAKGSAVLPGAALPAGRPPAGLLIAYYGLLTLVLLAVSQRRALAGVGQRVAVLVSGRARKWVVATLGVAAVLVWAVALTAPDDNVHVSFLDVGQGDAILIARGGRQVLVDGGPSPQAITLELGWKMPFWDRTIDVVVLTHSDADHLTGLVEVVRRYRVAQVIEAPADDELALYREWAETIDQRDIERTLAAAGQRITLGAGVTIEVLNPAGSTNTTDNDRSVVLRVSVGQVSFLLTGDVEEAGENDMLARRAGLASTVLKVGHHGSGSSTGAAFLSVVSPQIAVVSVGADNDYGHPSPALMARLAAQPGLTSIYRTDENGTVEFITDGRRLWVKTER